MRRARAAPSVKPDTQAELWFHKLATFPGMTFSGVLLIRICRRLRLITPNTAAAHREMNLHLQLESLNLTIQ